MMTDRDNQIVRFFEQPPHMANLRIIEKVFFRDQSYSYNIARERLQQIMKAGYIQAFHDEATNRNVYILNNPKVLKQRITLHKLLPREIYAEIASWGCKILKFDVEKEWAGGKYRSDGIIVFELYNPSTKKMSTYHFFIEVLLSNDSPNLLRYDEIYKTGEVQSYLGYDHFPKNILLVTDRGGNIQSTERCNVITIDTKLHQLVKILLA